MPNIQAATSEAQQRLLDQGKAVLMPAELREILRSFLPKSIKTKAMEEILEREGIIARVTLRSDHYHDIERVTIPALSPNALDFAVSIRKDAYLSHASAVHMLGLTQQQPRTIYVNKEQSPKPISQGPLSQEAINRAFAHTQRRSKYVFRTGDTQIVLLSGKDTGNTGVVEDVTTKLMVTNLERTLIDITVRPRYAGGVFQVAEAFRAASHDVDVTEMARLLTVLDYKYPYHQALGFYLTRAGLSMENLAPLSSLKKEFDFYLDYGMANPDYDRSWRIFFPLGV